MHPFPFHSRFHSKCGPFVGVLPGGVGPPDGFPNGILEMLFRLPIVRRPRSVDATGPPAGLTWIGANRPEPGCKTVLWKR